MFVSIFVLIACIYPYHGTGGPHVLAIVGFLCPHGVWSTPILHQHFPSFYMNSGLAFLEIKSQKWERYYHANLPAASSCILLAICIITHQPWPELLWRYCGCVFQFISDVTTLSSLYYYVPFDPNNGIWCFVCYLYTQVARIIIGCDQFAYFSHFKPERCIPRTKFSGRNEVKYNRL